MIQDIRKQYNAAFTDERYQHVVDYFAKTYGIPANFRIAETPVFVPSQLKKRLLDACDDIIRFIKRDDLKAITEAALPDKVRVPGEDAHPNFLCIDFAVTKDQNGEYSPQLIELQGFPSLFGYQYGLQNAFREAFPELPSSITAYLGDTTEANYISRLRDMIVGDEDPETTILLEIEPWKQNTAIDFAATRKLIGVEPVCLSELEKKNGKLWYKKDGKTIPVNRIYNRIIFDELELRDDLPRQFNMTDDDVDVKWIGHPNWYSRISKFCMPLLKGDFIPESRLLSSFDQFPTDLENYVLKPLYSFAGSGVRFNVSKEDLESVPEFDYENWMLQRKVQYEPVIQAADEGFVKTEIRILFIWPDNAPNPIPMINIARLSRGEMIGVKYNKNKTWVGGSICFMEP